MATTMIKDQFDAAAAACVGALFTRAQMARTVEAHDEAVVHFWAAVRRYGVLPPWCLSPTTDLKVARERIVRKVVRS